MLRCAPPASTNLKTATTGAAFAPTAESSFAGLPTREEREFYEAHDWSLDPFLSADQAICNLRQAVADFDHTPADWRRGETANTVYLLSCGLLAAADEHLRGRVLRIRRRIQPIPGGRALLAAAEALLTLPRSVELRRISRWRRDLESAVTPFLRAFAEGRGDGAHVSPTVLAPLATFLGASPPAAFLRRLLSVASLFRRLDLAPEDFLALADAFIAKRPNRDDPILLLGLRTSGSYIAPLVLAYLSSRGFLNLTTLTVHPDKGPSRDEASRLRRFARSGHLALVLDDAPQTGGTAVAALDMLRTAGFPRDRALFGAPTHPASRDWARNLAPDAIVSIPPEQWRRRRLLSPDNAGVLLSQYFAACGDSSTRIVESDSIRAVNRELDLQSESGRGARLKRVYLVERRRADGRSTTCCVLAKSVGWGWLSYHAFLAGLRLSDKTPALVGLRDGLIFIEWLPQSQSGLDKIARQDWLDAAAHYIALRVARLPLPAGAGKVRNGLRDLEKALSRAFGRPPADLAWRSYLQSRLERRTPRPAALIDANMGREDWLSGRDGPVKADYEHHGLGKAELNETDPAYDLAETLLAYGCSEDEERNLIGRYAAESRDFDVEKRLFLAKLLAGVATMERQSRRLLAAGDLATLAERHDRYIEAWHFLTVQAARQCGAFIGEPAPARCGGPIVALDIDGVLDRRIFGFPCATAAGLEALARFRAARLTVIVNTARSIAEVRAYCEAYGFSGGVAEYGACLWDRATGCETVLISDETRRQLDRLRRALQEVPGVCLDPRYRNSIRAYVYRQKTRAGGGLIEMLNAAMRPFVIGDAAPGPVPRQIAAHFLATLGLDKLTIVETSIDTSIVARDTDKGAGLLALRRNVLGDEAEIIAIGDSLPDLPMFRVADRAYAPGHIACRREAKLLGCRVVAQPFQRGLLQIATELAPDVRPERLRAPEDSFEALFLQLIAAADRSTRANLFRALGKPATFMALLH